ncbi:MAG: acetyltransferase [Candidatus Eremiobacteraeota bacterium]|nr:acetyltransferase [Candidatus Eremiobacteraeota bacterium]
MTGKSLLLIGGGGHCRSCIDVIESHGEFTVRGIIDKPEKVGGEVLGYPVLGTDEEIKQYTGEHCFFLVTLGQIESPKRRRELFEMVKHLGGSFAVIVSPRAYVSRHASLGEGTIVMHNALVNAGASVGKNCIVNTGAIVEHDAVIGDHCHIAPGAIVNGGVIVGKNTFIGSGAVSRHEIVIAENSFIRAQSMVKSGTGDGAQGTGRQVFPQGS